MIYWTRKKPYCVDPCECDDCPRGFYLYRDHGRTNHVKYSGGEYAMFFDPASPNNTMFERKLSDLYGEWMRL